MTSVLHNPSPLAFFIGTAVIASGMSLVLYRQEGWAGVLGIIPIYVILFVLFLVVFL